MTQQFNTVPGGVAAPATDPAVAQAAAERGYEGVMGKSAVAADKPLSDEARRFAQNQYNLHAAGNQPGQREYAEKVLKPALEAPKP